MKNRFFRALKSLLLVCSLIVFPLPCGGQGYTPAVSAKSAVLIDGESGNIIYEKNAHEPMGMASTTKIMTALLIAEELPKDKIISVPQEAVNTEGSSVYLVEGELLSVKELLYALLLASANDAAVTLAIAMSGSTEAFAERMNQRAAKLGLESTHFVNPHGLYDENHYTTAIDLAHLSAVALDNETIREIASTQKVTIPHGVTPQCPEGDGTRRYLQNHNKLLRLYDGAIGLKTGFTKKTGRCLVSGAERDGLRLIAVTLNAPDDWNDHHNMLDYGYSLYERVTLLKAGEFTYSFPVAGGAQQYVTLTNKDEVILNLPKKRQSPVYCVTSTRHLEFAPIARDRVIATLTLSVEGRNISLPLSTLYEVPRPNQTN